MEMILGQGLGRIWEMFLIVLAIIFTSSLLGAILGAVIASVFKRDRLLSDKTVTVFLSTLPAIPVSMNCTSVMANAVGQGALANPGILMMTTLACFPVAMILSFVLSFFWRAARTPVESSP
ncbi:hypothetical protein [Bremerella sp. P1]|uniref:hypothetical protein n=1 Tax=Bremerella sp. P1 TaxID=3026424 RepID=UPI00236872D9|nr:hypothetical protein [Bremerella sp. P1]WDI42141.1 hypothetical protein PSR63_27190 [Bremerella sp. P1]